MGADAYIGPSHRTSCYANASGGALSVTSDRKYPKNAAKTNGFGILARAWCGMYRGLSSPRIKQYKSVPCFRIVSGSIHRDALRACAARPNRVALCVYRAARCGERIERRRWRMKRDERVAAVKILSVRRKAAQKFWAPQQGHRALRSSIGKRCVGADAYIGPSHRTPCNLSLRTSDRCHWCGNPHPRPLGPLA